MTEQSKAEETNPLLINEIEREAIEFAQSLVSGPGKGGQDSLSKIERDAITYARNLLKKFGE